MRDQAVTLLDGAPLQSSIAVRCAARACQPTVRLSMLSAEERRARSLAARRSRSSAGRSLPSRTQSAPARSALIRCQAPSSSNLLIVSGVSSDIDQVSTIRSATVRSRQRT